MLVLTARHLVGALCRRLCACLLVVMDAAPYRGRLLALTPARVFDASLTPPDWPVNAIYSMSPTLEI